MQVPYYIIYMDNHKIWRIVVVISILLVVGAIIFKMKHTNSVPSRSVSEEVAQPTIKESSEDQKKPKTQTQQAPTIIVTSVQPTYESLKTEYQGRTVEFGESCVATPSSSTFKAGTAIFLDNRSGVARKIEIGNVVLSLTAYGYTNVVMSQVGTYQVSCDSMKNSGSIIIQQ